MESQTATACKRNVLLTHCLDCDVEGTIEVVVKEGAKSGSVQQKFGLASSELAFACAADCGSNPTLLVEAVEGCGSY